MKIARDVTKELRRIILELGPRLDFKLTRCFNFVRVIQFQSKLSSKLKLSTSQLINCDSVRWSHIHFSSLVVVGYSRNWTSADFSEQRYWRQRYRYAKRTNVLLW